MFDFLNPGFLLAGTALVSLPIIIHLINRMRFRRVRWAAMEFLLKSQKRNRRRLVIEQLLLLALRCLLVMLTVFLVSRYLGFSFGFFEQQSTLHVVVLDDTLSMTDRWREEGKARDCFDVGKELVVKEIARNAAQARTAQRLVLLTLSEPATIRFDQRLGEETVRELQQRLDDVKCSALRVDLLQGVEAARAVFEKSPLDRRLLHLVSDFRRQDWSEPEVTGLTKGLESLAGAGVEIRLIDTAHPKRSEMQRVAQYHDNLGIVELRPETRVAAKDMPVQFTVTVANYSPSERKNVRVTVKVNGAERLESSVPFQSAPPGRTSQTFQVSFDQLGFNQITANLEDEETGLQGDNTRCAVVEVRKQVPVLVVDGDPTNGLKPGGDTYHVQTLLTAAKGYQVAPRGVLELEYPTLDQYPSVYLLNVREVSDKALRNLQNYVREGGSVAFFLGDRVNADFYNQKLYAEGKGLFPAPLADRPFPALSDPEMQPDLFNDQPKLFLRSETHPVFAELYKTRSIFKYLPIKRYFPVPRRNWNPEPGRVEELATLPNQRAVRDYAGQAQELLDSLDRWIRNPDFEKYRPGLERHQRAVRDTTLGEKPLYELANALEALLHDRGEPKDAQRPNLAEFWELPEVQTLRGRIDKFRETVQLGDPLVIAAAHGKGRVVAFLTSAGRNWSDWAGGSVAALTYPVVLLELQKHLTSAGAETSLTVGTPLAIELDSSRYDARMRRFFQPITREADAAKPAGGPNAAEENIGLRDRGEQTGTVSGGRLSFLFAEAREPGIYLLDLARHAEEGNPGGPTRTEQRAYAFNVDPREGDLRRSAKDELERAAAGAQVLVPGAGWGGKLANRQTDLSESAWLYVLFLVILVCEQALAVHLSYHVKGSETTAPAPSQASAA
jgi:hypothetical protein